MVFAGHSPDTVLHGLHDISAAVGTPELSA